MLPLLPGIHKVHQIEVEELMPDNMRAAIIDFEGDPPYMMGIFIYTKVFTFYVEENQFRNNFKLMVLKILNIMEEIYMFAFSIHERKWILTMQKELQDQHIHGLELGFVNTLKIINLQEHFYESVTEVLILLGKRSSGDPLLRNNRILPDLFKLKRFEEIILHNRNCLKNEAFIFWNRFLPKFIL